MNDIDKAIKIVVEYEEKCVDSYEGGGPYADWSKTWDSSITDVYTIDVSIEPKKFETVTFLLPEGTETAYVVYMKYDDGNSFGRETGLIDIIHCCANSEDAHNLARMISKNKEEYTFEYTDDFGRKISIHNTGAGYFSSIEYIEVESFQIGSDKKKTRYH